MSDEPIDVGDVDMLQAGLDRLHRENDLLGTDNATLLKQRDDLATMVRRLVRSSDIPDNLEAQTLGLVAQYCPAPPIVREFSAFEKMQYPALDQVQAERVRCDQVVTLHQIETEKLRKLNSDYKQQIHELRKRCESLVREAEALRAGRQATPPVVTHFVAIDQEPEWED